jgi:hypothetical protein
MGKTIPVKSSALQFGPLGGNAIEPKPQGDKQTETIVFFEEIEPYDTLSVRWGLISIVGSDPAKLIAPVDPEFIWSAPICLASRYY